MKATGIVRKVDELGRIVLPIELRRTLNIEIRDPMEIYVDGEAIMLKKYTPACILCGEAGDLVEYKGKKVCRDCLSKIKEAI
jgi:transcriptional pleiotropic regulator of transition state genes